MAPHRRNHVVDDTKETSEQQQQQGVEPRRPPSLHLLLGENNAAKAMVALILLAALVAGAVLRSSSSSAFSRATPPRPPQALYVSVAVSPDAVINLDHGDPTMFESFWKRTGDKATVVLSGWQTMSYFSDTSNICWFLEPEFASQVSRLHHIVGNAVPDGHHIVVGVGSTQLIHAILYALSATEAHQPVSVVSAAPYYSVSDCSSLSAFYLLLLLLLLVARLCMQITYLNAY